MTKTTKSTRVKKARIIYEGKPKRTGWLGTSIIGLVIIILALFLLSQGTFFILEKPLFQQTNTTDTIVATVNGEPIYTSELDAQWNAIPMETKVSLSRADILDNMIQERLLLQEAQAYNISVSDEEVNKFINDQLTLLGITPEMFTEYLIAQDITMDEVMEIYRQQLMITTLFEEYIGQNISVSQEEINEYYNSYKKDFIQEATVTVRHILIEVNDNFNEEQAQERVTMILGLLEDDFSNFCELVSNYSMDLGSVNNCGEYTFSKGQFNNPAFEDPAFAMDVNELQVINTTFGLHIMLKTNETAKQELGLDDEVTILPEKPQVRTLIENLLRDQKARAIYSEYVASLVAKSDIEYSFAKLQGTPENTSEEGMSLGTGNNTVIDANLTS